MRFIEHSISNRIQSNYLSFIDAKLQQKMKELKLFNWSNSQLIEAIDVSIF